MAPARPRLNRVAKRRTSPFSTVAVKKANIEPAFLAKHEADHMLVNYEMLKSGEDSDFTVVCGGQEWQLHSQIVCYRSKFFKKALRNGFKVTKQLVVL